jgi:hypothetical protein
MDKRIEEIRLKLERAEKHILDLEIAINTFRESKPYTIGSKPHPVAEIDHTTLVLTSVNPVPKNISIICGDAIHNLRSSLDHLAWQLVKVGGGTPTRRTCFPVFKEAKGYAASIKRGIIDGADIRAKELIESVQCHVTGDKTLWMLHELDIIDKHRLLITVVSVISKWGVNVPEGQTLWFDESGLPTTEAGYEIVNIPTSTYQRQDDQDFQLSTEITFCEPEVIERDSVLLTLKKMSKFVIGVVDKFGDFLN